MKKIIIACILALALILSSALATSAASPRIEEIEYMGFGIVKAELRRDCDWYSSAAVTLTDASGNAVAFEFIGGEEDEIYLRAAEIADGSAYTLAFSLNGAEQSVRFDATTGQSCKIAADGSVSVKVDREKCDVCGKSGHDDDVCPTRVTEDVLSGDADALARVFDIDRCERCNGIGHDDEGCPVAR